MKLTFLLSLSILIVFFIIILFIYKKETEQFKTNNIINKSNLYIIIKNSAADLYSKQNNNWNKIASNLKVEKINDNLSIIKFKKSIIQIECDNSNCKNLQILINKNKIGKTKSILQKNWDQIKNNNDFSTTTTKQIISEIKSQCIGGYNFNGKLQIDIINDKLCSTNKSKNSCTKYCTWIPNTKSTIKKLQIYDYNHLQNLIDYCKEKKGNEKDWKVSDIHISNWDVSKVTDMSNLFKDINDFNEDITDWNVSNVTKMDEMFMNAFAFNQDISGWNVSNVKSYNNIFDKKNTKMCPPFIPTEFKEQYQNLCNTNIINNKLQTTTTVKPTTRTV